MLVFSGPLRGTIKIVGWAAALAVAWLAMTRYIIENTEYSNQQGMLLALAALPGLTIAALSLSLVFNFFYLNPWPISGIASFLCGHRLVLLVIFILSVLGTGLFIALI